MGRKILETLTESMFYVLMALLRQARCGTEIADFVAARTKSRVRLGPGTLYTILAKFEEVGLIRETAVEGRKRTYVLTDEGRARYEEELVRLRSCLADAEEERRAMDHETEHGAQTAAWWNPLISDRIEGWLESMARPGPTLPTTEDAFLVHFRRGEPAAVRYRLEPMGSLWSRESQDYCRALGWDRLGQVRAGLRALPQPRPRRAGAAHRPGGAGLRSGACV